MSAHPVHRSTFRRLAAAFVALVLVCMFALIGVGACIGWLLERAR